MTVLVRLLALLLVPVLIVTNPNVANAAAYGPAKSHGFSFDGNGSARPFGNVSCNVVAFWESSAPAVHTRLRCDQEWNAESDYTMTWIVGGVDEDGEFCETAEFSNGPTGEGVTTTASGTILCPDGDSATARMDDFCWTYEAPDAGGFDSTVTAEGCFTLDLGEMATSDPVCAAGEPSRPSFGPRRTMTGDVRFQVREGHWNVFMTGSTAGQWAFYTILSGGAGGYSQYSALNSKRDISATALNGASIAADYSSPFPAVSWPKLIEVRVQSRNDMTPLYTWEVVGSGYVHLPTLQAATGLGATGARSSVTVLPQETVVGAIGQAGVTDPATCSFYWGVKIASTPDDRDEPIRDLEGGGGTTNPPTDEPPPGDVEEGCGSFSLSDPATWASGGICALVSLISDLLGMVGDLIGVVSDVLAAILGLVANLVGALLDMLTDLFIPDEYPDWSSLDSPLPSGWLPDLPSVTGGACGPLTFPQLHFAFAGLTVGPVTFADTCDDPWPLVRTFTYNGLLALVLVSAIWLAFRAVTAGLGMGVAPSSGGDDE